MSMLAAWAIVKIRGVSAETAAKVVPELLVGLDVAICLRRDRHAAESLGELGPLAKSAVEKLEQATQGRKRRRARRGHEGPEIDPRLSGMPRILAPLAARAHCLGVESAIVQCRGH